MYKGFDAEKFMSYLEREFYGMENSMLRKIVENLIDYGHKHEQISKDQFVQWLANMIPEVTFGEVAAFMEDDCLTESGKMRKAEALKRIEIPEY